MLKGYHPLVDVEVRSDPGLMNIRGVNHQLSKILMNLVSNATEAMPDGGRILISAENCDVTTPVFGYEEIREGSYVLLRVADSGIGIPAGNLRRIFEPFYSKKQMGRSGTGLGMSVVWGSVKDHGGYIDVSSTEGKGTIFTLYFPSTQESVMSLAPPITKTSLRGNGESILIVDDVPEQREIASRILGALGYSVQSVGSGEEAVEYLKESSVDLLILDMHMEPGIDGLETYRRISQLRPGQRALIITGFAETERIGEALREGVGCCVKKPYLPEDIGFAAKLQLEKLHRASNVASSNCLN
jgi:CheY-like chemotaxis protein